MARSVRTVAKPSVSLGCTVRRIVRVWDVLQSDRSPLPWYIAAQRVELYRSNYIYQSLRDPSEYPGFEPDIATLIDSLIVATAMLARIFSEITRSQEDIRRYSGDQIDVKTAVRELVDPNLSALSKAEGVLTARAAALTSEAAALNLGSISAKTQEAVRVHAIKAGLLRGFLGVVARLTVMATHQVTNLRENIRTKGGYDASKEILKWLISNGYENTFAFVSTSVGALVALATTWPAMFNFLHPLLRLLGLQ
jgi:hypothetical protein